MHGTESNAHVCIRSYLGQLTLARHPGKLHLRSQSKTLWGQVQLVEYLCPLLHWWTLLPHVHVIMSMHMAKTGEF